MTIKQQGGIFGRNPTFNDVTVDNELDLTNATIVGSPTFNDAQTIPSSLTITGENIDRLIKLDAVNKTIDTSTEWSSSGTTEFIQTMKARQSGGWRYVGLGQVGAELRFYNSNTNADVTTGEAFAINTGKSLIMRGGGNVVFNAGAGIDFSATSGTGTSELFDDYEEGTWTPVVSDGTNNATTSAAEGTYTKVGRQVTLSGRFVLSSTGSTSGGIRITGLPYAVSSGNAGRGSLNVSYAANFTLTAGHSITGSPASGATHIFLGVWDVGGFTTDLLATELTATSTLFFSAVYFTA